MTHLCVLDAYILRLFPILMSIALTLEGNGPARMSFNRRSLESKNSYGMGDFVFDLQLFDLLCDVIHNFPTF